MNDLTRPAPLAAGRGGAGAAASRLIGARAAGDPDGGRARAEPADREGGHAARAAPGQVRRSRRDDLPREHQEVHRGDRRAGAGGFRRLGGPAAADRGDGQHRRRAGHRGRLDRRPAPLCGQAGRPDRHRRLPRQEIRRLVHAAPRCTASKWKTNKWIAIPMGGSGGPAVYRSLLAEGGRLRQDPRRPRRLPRHVPQAEEVGHPAGFALGHAVGDAQRVLRLAAVGARRQPDRRERQGGDQLEGDDRGAEVRQGAVSDDDPRHELLARPEQQQGVCGRARSR